MLDLTLNVNPLGRDLLTSFGGGGGGVNLHMLRYGDVQLFWVLFGGCSWMFGYLFGLFSDFWVSFFWLFSEFWVSFFGKI